MSKSTQEPLEFKTLDLKPEILKAVEEKGYTHATPIQSASLPSLLKGKDFYVSSYAIKQRRAYFRMKIWIEVNGGTEEERVIKKELRYGEGYNEYVPPEPDTTE